MWKSIIIFLGLLTAAYTAHWAIAVAGSTGYYNYRHQSDLAHFYHLFNRSGIPDENIILFFADDIAYDPRNPFPGNIINWPNGTNLYPGLLKDYTGDQVTVGNFLGVLYGNMTEGSKILRSGPHDNVFIYLVDHGGPGVFCFPTDYLYSHQLMGALHFLYSNNRYRNLVIYVESCESGSMFAGQNIHNLTLADMRIYVTTAAASDQSSYACYFDPVRQTFLGDYYSVNWLENSDNSLLYRESLFLQFLTVRYETLNSTVMMYGNRTISHLHLTQFQGNGSRPKPYPPPLPIPPPDPKKVVRSDRVTLVTQLRQLESLIKNPIINLDIRRIQEVRRLLNQEIDDLLTAVEWGSRFPRNGECDRITDSRKVQKYIETLRSIRPVTYYDLEVISSWT